MRREVTILIINVNRKNRSRYGYRLAKFVIRVIGFFKAVDIINKRRNRMYSFRDEVGAAPGADSR